MDSNHNQLLQIALSATTNGVLITDNTQQDNPIIYVNSGFESMTGYQTEEIIGRNCRFLQGEDTDKEAVAALREAIATGQNFQVELQNYKKDGTPFWNELSISPVKNEQGQVTHFVGVQSDITDRKEKEIAQRAQLMAENVVDTVREPMLILNEDFTIHSVNKSFYGVFQTTPEETIGEHIFKIGEGYLDVAALKSLLEKILPHKNPFEDFEITHDFPRIGTKTFLLNARRLDRDATRPEYILLAFEDITRFKQSETARFESERHSRFIIEGLKDLVVVTTDTAAKIISWNKGAQRILGYTDNEVLGSSVAQLFKDDTQSSPPLEDELPLVIQKGQIQRERWITKKDGGQIWALSLFSALHDEAGTLQGFAILLYDQTARKNLETELATRAEELATRDQAKDQFLAMLGHELRNPLAAISNSLQFMKEVSTEEVAERPLQIAGRQVEQMNQLIGDLLDVARVTQGKISLKKEPLALDAIVTSVAHNLQQRADAKSIEIALDVKNGIYVNGDAVRLEQVVNNLVTNAIKYTDRGQVFISLHAHQEQAVLTIRDTGMGIDAQLLPHIFDLFSQAERTLARSEGGLGVGLTIVKQIVELHGGAVAAQSEGKSQGSAFQVRLPLNSTSEKVQSKDSKSQPHSETRLKVLLVEDTSDVAEMFVLMLRMWGYEVLTADNGETAINLALAERPHIALLDIGLPVLNGYQVAEKLREHFTASQMQLFALTGYAAEEDKARAKEVGFNYHLAKPVDFNALKKLLAECESELKTTA